MICVSKSGRRWMLASAALSPVSGHPEASLPPAPPFDPSSLPHPLPSPCRTDDTVTLAVNSSCWRSRFSSSGTCMCVNCTDAAKVPNASRAPYERLRPDGNRSTYSGKTWFGPWPVHLHSQQFAGERLARTNKSYAIFFGGVLGVGWNHKKYTTTS